MSCASVTCFFCGKVNRVEIGNYTRDTDLRYMCDNCGKVTGFDVEMQYVTVSFDPKFSLVF